MATATLKNWNPQFENIWEKTTEVKTRSAYERTYQTLLTIWYRIEYYMESKATDLTLNDAKAIMRTFVD